MFTSHLRAARDAGAPRLKRVERVVESRVVRPAPLLAVLPSQRDVPEAGPVHGAALRSLTQQGSAWGAPALLHARRAWAALGVAVAVHAARHSSVSVVDDYNHTDDGKYHYCRKCHRVQRQTKRPAPLLAVLPSRRRPGLRIGEDWRRHVGRPTPCWMLKQASNEPRSFVNQRVRASRSSCRPAGPADFWLLEHRMPLSLCVCAKVLPHVAAFIAAMSPAAPVSGPQHAP